MREIIRYNLHVRRTASNQLYFSLMYLYVVRYICYKPVV